MIRTAIILFVFAMSQMSGAHAKDNQVSAEQSQKTPLNVAVLLLDNDEYGPQRPNSYYHLVVGSLQVAFKRAKVNVPNAMLASDQHPEKLGDVDALKQTVAALNASYLDNLMLVDAIVLPEVGAIDQTIQLQLQWQLYDVKREMVFASREVTTSVAVKSGCADACFENLLSSQFVRLALGEASQAVSALRSHHAASQSELVAGQQVGGNTAS